MPCGVGRTSGCVQVVWGRQALTREGGWATRLAKYQSAQQKDHTSRSPSGNTSIVGKSVYCLALTRELCCSHSRMMPQVKKWEATEPRLGMCALEERRASTNVVFATTIHPSVRFHTKMLVRLPSLASVQLKGPYYQKDRFDLICWGPAVATDTWGVKHVKLWGTCDR